MNQQVIFPVRRGMRYPAAWVHLRGSRAYPHVQGTVRFYEHGRGVLVITEVIGLPTPHPPARAPFSPSTSTRAVPAPAMNRTPSPT